MKNKRIKKGFIIGMSAMMLASAVAPVDAPGSYLEEEQNRMVVGRG